MALTFQELVAKVGLDARQYKEGMKDIRQEGRSTAAGMNKVALGIGASMVAAGGFAIKAASDLGEQVNKVNVVFGDNAREINNWSKDLTDSFGVSRRQALESAGVFGNMLKPMGIMPDQVAKISQEFVQLGGDMASFNNASPEETLNALRAGLAGETEPLRRFGVFLNDARIQAEAMRMGLVKTKVDTEKVAMAQDRLNLATAKLNQALREHGPASQQVAQAKIAQATAEQSLEKAMAGSKVQLDAASKALAVHAIVMRDTRDAQGDFARTASSLPNTMRTLRADVENLAAGFGQMLLPSAVKVTNWAKGALGWMQDHQHALQVLIVSVGGLAAVYTTFTLASKAAAAAQAVMTASTAAYRIATGAATAEQLALNAAIRANVIGIVITAIAALAAGVIYAYKHFETFRHVVDAVMGFIRKAIGVTVDFIKDHWQAILAVLTGPFGIAAKLIYDHFETIKKMALRTALAVVEPFSHLPGKLGGWARSAKDAMQRELAKLDAAGALSSSFQQADALAISYGAATGQHYVISFQAAQNLAMAGAVNEHLSMQKARYAKEAADASAAGTAVANARADSEKKANDAKIPVYRDTGAKAAQAVADGIADRKAAAAQQAADLAQKAADAAARVLDRQKTRLQSKLDIFSTFASRAFDAINAADLTPTEKLLKDMQKGIETQQLQERLDDATKAQTEAQNAYAQAKQQEGETDQEFAARKQQLYDQQLQAGRAFRDAQVAQTLAALQTQAEEERKARDNQLYMEQLHFQTRLTALQGYLESGKASAKEATKRLRDLLADFDIDMTDTGELLGNAFAQGLYNSIPQVVAAAKAVREAAEKAKDTRTEANRAATKAKQAATAATRRQGKRGDNPMADDRYTDSGGSILDRLTSFAQAFGITVTSTTGGGHVKGSYHYQGRAIDVDGGPDKDRAFFQAAISHFGARNIKELFYDPMGYYIDNGQVIRGAIGGHGDHVHLALGDGGVVMPRPGGVRATIAERGVPEAVIPLDGKHGLGQNITFVFTGNSFLTSDRETQRAIWNLLEPFASQGKIQVST